jgi:hypothetical protein
MYSTSEVHDENTMMLSVVGKFENIYCGLNN